MLNWNQFILIESLLEEHVRETRKDVYLDKNYNIHDEITEENLKEFELAKSTLNTIKVMEDEYFRGE